jgi:hypothetical protein
MVPAGPHLFETLNAATGKPDHRGRTDNTVPDGTGVTVALAKLP